MSNLFGCRYIGPGDPVDQFGPIPYGFQWADTGTNTLWERDPSGTAWVNAGTLGVANMGMLPIQGGPVMGPITGPSGLAQLTGADFDSLLVGGLPVGTKTYTDQQIAALKALIQSAVQAALLGSATVNNIRSNFASAQGVAGFQTTDTTYFTVPPPSYPDGTPANPSDCIVLPYAYQHGPWPDQTGGTSYMVTDYIKQKPGDHMSWTAYTDRAGGGIYPGTLGYSVIAFRSN